MSTTLADQIASDLFDKYRETNDEVKSCQHIVANFIIFYFDFIF